MSFSFLALLFLFFLGDRPVVPRWMHNSDSRVLPWLAAIGCYDLMGGSNPNLIGWYGFSVQRGVGEPLSGCQSAVAGPAYVSHSGV